MNNILDLYSKKHLLKLKIYEKGLIKNGIIEMEKHRLKKIIGHSIKGDVDL